MFYWFFCFALSHCFHVFIIYFIHSVDRNVGSCICVSFIKLRWWVGGQSNGRFSKYFGKSYYIFNLQCIFHFSKLDFNSITKMSTLPFISVFNLRIFIRWWTVVIIHFQFSFKSIYMRIALQIQWQTSTWNRSNRENWDLFHKTLILLIVLDGKWRIYTSFTVYWIYSEEFRRMQGRNSFTLHLSTLIQALELNTSRYCSTLNTSKSSSEIRTKTQHI